jgi:hypothetical protein
MLQHLQDIAIQTKLRRYNRKFQANESFIGIKPTMSEYGSFLKGYVSTNMSDKWQGKDIPIKGNNYWTIGPPTQTGNSSRFDPTSNLYQAWFGIYTHVGVDGKQFGLKDNEPDIELLKRLAEVDQDFWLKAYGDPNPFSRLTKFESRGHLLVDGNKAWLYYGEMHSHSDVGFKGRGYEKAYGRVRAEKFDLDTASKASLFIPNPQLWSNYVNSYHPINLKGFFTVIPFERSTVCIYLNGAEYQDNNKKHYDTWPLLERDALALIKSVKTPRI